MRCLLAICIASLLTACGGRGNLDPAAVEDFGGPGTATGGEGGSGGSPVTGGSGGVGGIGGSGGVGGYGGTGGVGGYGGTGGVGGYGGTGGVGGYGGTGGVGGYGGTGGSGGSNLDWHPCSSEVSNQAECALAPLPLDYDNPVQGSIDVHVKRFPSPLPSKGQVWLLQGGPGGDGESLEFLVPIFWDIAPNLEVYLPDHRGTGKSTYLTCPAQEAKSSEGGSSVTPNEATACAAAVESAHPGALDNFTVTGAAEDLGMLVDLTRAPGDDAYVWGVSYGTYWALRYMQVRPAQATGVILDSIARPAFSFTDYDINMNEVAKRIFDACADDSFCNARLGSDPWAWMAQLSTKLVQGHCPTSYGLDKNYYKQLFSTLMIFPFEYRSLLPALAYRIDRCSPQDEDAITHFVDFLSQSLGSSSGHSSVIRTHIGLSELYTYPPLSLQQMIAQEQGTVVSTTATPEERRMYDAWPMYPRDDWWGEYPSTSVPVLMLNGTLDAQTVIWEAEKVGPHFTAPHQTFVTIPRATHGVIDESPLASDPNQDCGAVLLRQFLASPTNPLDTSCVNDIAPLDFHGEYWMADALFGEWDTWGDGFTNAPTPAALTPPIGAMENLRKKLRAKRFVPTPAFDFAE